MALTIKSSDTAVAANAVIALQEHIEMGNKVSENIRNNIELFNQAADSFDKSFKEKIELIDKAISKINSSFSSLMKKIVSALIAFVFIEVIFFFGYLFYDSHKTNETKSALQSELDKALYNVSNLKGFIVHIYNQDSQKASEDFTKWLNTNGDSSVQ